MVGRLENIYDARNHDKKILQMRKDHDTFFLDAGEIWYIKLGQNIGSEQNEKKDFRRPILVLKKFGNLYYGIPLTSQQKDNDLFYYRLQTLKYLPEHTYRNSRIIFSQIRSFDKKRFLDKIGRISARELYQTKEKLRTIVF